MCVFLLDHNTNLQWQLRCEGKWTIQREDVKTHHAAMRSDRYSLYCYSIGLDIATFDIYVLLWCRIYRTDMYWLIFDSPRWMAISGAVLRIEWSAWLIFLRKRRVILSCTLASKCPSSDGDNHPEKRFCLFVWTAGGTHARTHTQHSVATAVQRAEFWILHRSPGREEGRKTKGEEETGVWEGEATTHTGHLAGDGSENVTQ